MLTNKRQILEMVALMREHGIVDVVLCPGSRNVPIVHTISQTEGFCCHALTDERSAGFFALGRALATGKTVAVCVTSGSALVNLHPAVTEAFYQQVPLLIISADRPSAWIGQMDGQTMPQTGVFGSMVKYSCCLETNDIWHVNRMVNEALLECTHRSKGPVHINVPIEEPLYEFGTEELPSVRVIRRIEGLYPDKAREIAELLHQSTKRMIIIGQKPADRQVKPAYMNELNRGYVSLCENLANCGEGSVALNITDRLMDEVVGDRRRCAGDYRPDLVITVGGHIVSKKLKNWLRQNPPKQHWHVSPEGTIADTFGCLTTVIEAEPYRFLEMLAYITIPIEEESNYPQLWRTLAAETRTQTTNKPQDECAEMGGEGETGMGGEGERYEGCAKMRSKCIIESKPGTRGESEPGTRGESKPGTESESKPGTRGESEPGTESEGDTRISEKEIVGKLMGMLPEGAVLHLANSSSVRYAQEFPLHPSVTVCCNRGINGIEGCLSSAVGFASATPERQNFVVIGDLAFFYDQNALWNRELPDNLHILLLNNHGGEIFNTLPVPDDERTRSFVMAKHHTNAEAVAQQYGLLYMNRLEEMQEFVDKGHALLEVE